MATPTKDYDPTAVSIVLGPSHNVSGFADGTFVTIDRNNPAWTVVSGAGGEHARSKSSDRSGTIVLTLMQTSISNDYLSQMLIDDETSNSGKRTLNIIDANGDTVVIASEVWVQQAPTIEYGKDLGDREWTLEAGDIDIKVGGTV
jgi:hypothetical protein